MDKKLNRIIESGTRLTFLLLLAFTGVTLWLGQYVLAGIEACAIVAVYIYYRQRQRRRRSEMRRYVETLAYQVDDASKSSLVNFPLPMVILRIDTREIIWGNDIFYEIAGLHEGLFETHITSALPGFDIRWVMEGKTMCPYDVAMGDRKYNIYGNLVRSGTEQGRSLLATLFWIDITDFSALRESYEKSRPVVSLIVVDSYEELYKGTSERENSALTAAIDERLVAWAKSTGGIVRRIERDRYLFIFEQQGLVSLTADKFSVLESMHEVKNSEGITATLSIGIGKGEGTFAELYQNALIGIDMALSRGGDQVVIKTKNAFEFYGGRSKEVEKRTKVKSRVMANALRQLIRDSSHVFIMGHKISDLDCIGAAAGVAAIVRKSGKTPYLIFDHNNTSAIEMIDKLRAEVQYEDSFITEDEAIIKADSASLVVVVDTSRPDIVEAPKLLETVQRVAVIDHHRRAASYIENAAISHHETYASSASELVAELLQYIVSAQEVLDTEAEAMLAGIFLDTKGFTIKTGVRTFEAAAFLRQLGADTIEVRKMFSGDLNTYIRKYSLIATARQIMPGVSMAVTEEQVERIVAAQAADDLINVADIVASFVVYGEGAGTSLSARSYGKVNVQLICEKIGGGGSLTGAGAQFADKKPREVAVMLTKAIEDYLRDNPVKD